MDEIEYLNETEEYPAQRFPAKPRNSLDSLKFTSEAYEAYKFNEQIRGLVKDFNFDSKVVNEITQTCARYKDSLKLNRLLPIVIYKVIKKYNFPISLNELVSKKGFNISNYLKNSSSVQVEGSNTPFKELVYSRVTFVIDKLKDYYNINPMAFKQKIKTKDALVKLTDKFFSNKDSYNDIEAELTKIKIECREFIFSKNFASHEFNQFFSDKINVQALSVSLVRYKMQCNFVTLSLCHFSKLFSVSQRSISKGILYIKQYLTLNNNI